MDESKVEFVYSDPADGALRVVRRHELACLTCRWPLDSDHDGWFNPKLKLRFGDYASAIERAVVGHQSTTLHDVDGAGQFLIVEAREGVIAFYSRARAAFTSAIGPQRGKRSSEPKSEFVLPIHADWSELLDFTVRPY